MSRLWVTRPELNVTIEAYDSRFRLQEVDFHVNHLSQGLLPCITFYATSKLTSPLLIQIEDSFFGK